MKFKPGDKVRRKTRKHEIGIVQTADVASQIDQGIFKVPVLFKGLTYPSWPRKDEIELVEEPNDILKKII